MTKSFSEHNLTLWQGVSFLSRGVALAVGVLQSFFIVRLLSVGEWGLIQIAASVGGALGIYQHLGLASGSTREISAAKNDTEVFKIFVTSLFIRYIVTIPLALGLYIFSERIAIGTYNQEILILPLKIYALVILAQGAQSILNSVISGTKRFKRLFIYQALISLASLVMYLPLVFLYRVQGYFFAMLAFNIISTFTLTYLALKPLKCNFSLPGVPEFKLLLKELLSISMAIYFVKILITMWEKMGPIILGIELSPEIVGIFAFGLLYAKKVTSISDAVTDVNLPVMSDKLVHDIKGFATLFSSNFNKVFSLIVFAGFSVSFWFTQVTDILVGEGKYNQSYPLILPLTFAFVFYSFVNIIKSSVLIPAKMIKELVLSFVGILVVSGLAFVVIKVYQTPLISMSYAMFLGGFAGLILTVLFSQLKISYTFFNWKHILILVQALAISYAGGISDLVWKIGFFAIYVGLYFWAVYTAGFFNVNQMLSIIKKKGMQHV